MGAQENKRQTPQNDILHMKSTEFYLRFPNSCEIWHSFSRALKKASLKPYYDVEKTVWKQYLFTSS